MPYFSPEIMLSRDRGGHTKQISPFPKGRCDSGHSAYACLLVSISFYWWPVAGTGAHTYPETFVSKNTEFGYNGGVAATSLWNQS